MFRLRPRAGRSLLTVVCVLAAGPARVAPAQTLPNPYHVADTAFGQLPDGRSYGAVSAIYPGPDGRTIWVAERCGQNTCVDRQHLTTIFQFDLSGRLLRQFGAGHFAWPHGMFVDREGNVWVTDAVGFGAQPPGMGHVVYKFSPEGELRLTLGRKGVAGDGPDTFTQPSDVLVAPDGSIFVADGHGAGGNNRIVKFSPDGRYLKEWGGTGEADGQLRDPHGLAMDSRGRLFVADRANNRIQIFDQEGNHLASWPQFGRPSGLYIDAHDVLYAADSESNMRRNPGWRRGIYIGSALDGTVTAFIPDPEPDPDNSATSGAEGVAADAEGNVYGAEVGPMTVRKYVRHGGHEGHAGHGSPVLGTVVFPNSAAEAAREPFLRGVALLHSFEYDRAAHAFREARRADPGFALAYWAEALTHSHVLWREENLPASRAVLALLAPTPAERLARAPTGLERSFGEAVEAFYAEGTLSTRVAAYAEAMRRHARRFPDDQEAAAFAAHAIMLASYTGDPERRETLAREAIGLAQRVAAANPDHPGAVHYLIHLYDNPGMAAEGLAFARAYDKIAPDAEHALHMPSHIYLQLGMWEDVARSNERAWAASRALGRADWHAFSWLQYAYLQQGRWREARGLIDTARTLTSAKPEAYVDVLFARARLEFQYAVETGSWDAPITAPPPPSGGAMSDRERGFRAAAASWLALGAVRRGEPGAAAIVAPFLARADSARQGTAIAAGPASVAFVLEALAARARGDREGYLRALRDGAAAERRLTAFVGPPERLFALELLGEELLAEGHHADAAQAFEEVLALCPRRSQALLGLARARAAAGDAEGAAGAYRELRESWARADREVAAAIR
jgi:DNA-binding beta-propeller fold protein YncE/tetratricopeptide (TPR) repeat protein